MTLGRLRERSGLRRSGSSSDLYLGRILPNPYDCMTVRPIARSYSQPSVTKPQSVRPKGRSYSQWLEELYPPKLRTAQPLPCSTYSTPVRPKVRSYMYVKVLPNALSKRGRDRTDQTRTNPEPVAVQDGRTGQTHAQNQTQHPTPIPPTTPQTMPPRIAHTNTLHTHTRHGMLLVTRERATVPGPNAKYCSCINVAA